MASKKKVLRRKAKSVSKTIPEQDVVQRTEFEQYRLKEREESEERKRRIAVIYATPKISYFLHTDYSEAPSLDSLFKDLSMWEIKFLLRMNDSFKKRVRELDGIYEEEQKLQSQLAFYKRLDKFSAVELDEIVSKISRIIKRKQEEESDKIIYRVADCGPGDSHE
jgi:hypothetical protein